MKRQIRDIIESMRRTHPLISKVHARYLYAKPADLSRKGRRIVVYLILWSDDGQVSWHKTTFDRKRPMSVVEWAGWVQVNAPTVFVNNVLPFINRSHASTWNIDRVFGWHFATRRS